MANPKPRPLLPPVTNTTLPERSNNAAILGSRRDRMSLQIVGEIRLKRFSRDDWFRKKRNGNCALSLVTDMVTYKKI